MFMEFKIDNLKNFPNILSKKINNYKEEINKITKDGKNYKDIIKKMDDMNEDLDRFFTPLSHLNSVNNSKETQKAYEESIPILSEYSSFVSSNEALFKKIKSLKGENEEEKRVLELEVRDFKLNGANLKRDDKEKLKDINLKLNQLSNKFSQNLLDATNDFELIVNEDDVEGMPQAEKNQARIEIDGKVKYKFTLQIPSYIAYMTYGKNRKIREKLYKAYNTRAPQNQEVIDEILKLRYEKAKLLGFNNFANYSLANKDAKSEKKVIEFLYELLNSAKEKAKKEMQELKNFAKELDNIKDLAPYDTSYYSNKLKEKKFNFDESQLKPYFKQENVLNGMLDIVSKLFNIKFEKSNTSTWHESVKVYDILENGKTFARIYFDLEARESKRGGAWMHNWQSHYINSNNKEELASAFVVANFAATTNTQPSLLRHDDIVTLFHEMGHAIHHLFSKVKERSISGIEGVAWDVVEFPSQFLENFAYEKSILKTFSKHYETNQSIKEDFLDKIKKSKNFQSALFLLRQIEFSLFDFKLHQKLYQGDEVNKLINDIRKETSLLETPNYVRFEHGFAHIFAGGYAAGYYSYKWAEVFSADAFFKCLDNGEFNKEKAIGYKKYILEKGASKEMSDLYIDWLGNRPKVESLIKLYGIKND